MKRQRQQIMNGIPAHPSLYDGKDRPKAEPPKETRRPIRSGVPLLNKFERLRREKARQTIQKMKVK